MDKLIFNQKDHSYFIDGKRLASVTEILAGVGLINFEGVDPGVLKRAADFGSAVHLACCLDDQGDLDEDSLDPALKPYLDAWRSFRGDMKFDAIEQPLCHPDLGFAWRSFRGDMKFDAIEQPLCHPDLGFAGTPDRIAGNTIYDLKTGTAVYPVTGIQLAGYAILADFPTARRLAVQLKADGTYHVHEFKDRTDRGVFLAALSVYQWRRNHATNSS